jgi:hypothetical protein
MSSSDRRAAARRKAWGRGPMILRFRPAEGGDGLSMTVPTPLPDDRLCAEQPADPAPAMIGLRLLTDYTSGAENAPSGATMSSESSPEGSPSPRRGRRVISHKAHTQAPVHHLRVYEPTDSRASRRPRVPVTPS